MTFQFHYRLQCHARINDFVRRCDTIKCNSRTYGIEITLTVPEDSCTVVTVTDRNPNTGFFQQSQKFLIVCELLMGRGQILFVCSCKMSKRTFDRNSRKFADPQDLRKTFFGMTKTDSCHTGIKCQMDRMYFTCFLSLQRYLFSCFIIKHCRTDIQLHQCLIIFRKDITEDQYRFF